MGETDLVSDVIRRVNDSWSLELSLLYRFPVGAEGVYAVATDSSRFALRSWSTPPAYEVRFLEIHKRLDKIRAAGVPVPSMLNYGQLGDAFVEIAEWADGEVPAVATGPIITDAIRVLDLMKDQALDPSERWGQWLLRSIGDDAAGFCKPRRLLQGAVQGRHLLRQAQQLMAALIPSDLGGGDIVHCDFGIGNVLAIGEAISAVVDWSGCRDGSRAFDLTALKWDLDVYHPGECSTIAVEEALRACARPDRVSSLCHFAVRHATAAIGRPDQDEVWSRAIHDLEAA